MLPIYIGDMKFLNELIELGASVNLIPLRVSCKVGDLRIEPTKATL